MMSRLIALLAFAIIFSGCANRGGGSGPIPGDPMNAPSSGPANIGGVKSAQIHTELASLYLQRGQPGVALEELREAISASSSYAPAYTLLGVVYMDLKENSLAQQNFEKALSIAPGDADANNNYGWFLCQSNREKESIRYFMTAIRNPLYTTPSRSYVNAGICTMKANPTEAEDYFSRALRFEPNNPQALYNAALLNYRRNNLGQAREFANRLNKTIEPTAESTWLQLRIERKLGDQPQEQALVTQMRRRYSGSPEFQEMLKGNFE